jgi:hypothetical protein
MKNKGYTIFIWSPMLFVFLFGCKKFIEIPPASNLIVSLQVFSDSTDANSAVLGMYTTMIPFATSIGTYSGGLTIYTGLSSDEIYSTRNIAYENAFYKNSLLSSTANVDLFWNNSYPLIYKANAIIEGLNASNSIPSSAKNQFIGEAKVVRAFCYFNLINLYGDVPLVLSTDYRVNATTPRTSKDSVYRQIINDLSDAQGLLPQNYLTAGRVRPNKYTAMALLAKVYLYTNQWANAENISNQIINSSLYSLSPLNRVFYSNINMPSNNEPIWQLLPVQLGYETTEGNFFVPASKTVIPKYNVNTNLFNAFELTDQRFTTWLGINTVGTKKYYYPRKYTLGHDGNSSPVENYVVFRLGEQYLIRAEARAQLGESNSIADLNSIRERAGLSDYAGPNTKDSILNAIYHERQVELFCEWGNRWFDLKRIGKIDAIMGSPGNFCTTKGGTWSSNWILYPLKTSLLQSNVFLTQNPGYQ